MSVWILEWVPVFSWRTHADAPHTLRLPPSKPMNSRRFIASPKAHNKGIVAA
jgi:hypothetical protein